MNPHGTDVEVFGIGVARSIGYVLLLLSVGTMCGCGVTTHTLAWKGYDGTDDPDAVVYLFDGEEVQITGFNPKELIARVPELRSREKHSLKRLFSDGTFSPGELRTLAVVAKVIELRRGDILLISLDYLVGLPGDDPSGPSRRYPWYWWDIYLEDMAKSRGIRVRYGERPGVEYP